MQSWAAKVRIRVAAVRDTAHAKIAHAAQSPRCCTELAVPSKSTVRLHTAAVQLEIVHSAAAVADGERPIM